jgi:type II secretory pathway component PulF
MKPKTFFEAVRAEMARGLAIHEAIRICKEKFPNLYQAFLKMGGRPDERFVR